MTCFTPHTYLAYSPQPPFGIPVLIRQAQETARIEILAHADSLKDLSLYLNDHPEIGYEEHKAHAKVTAYLKDQGFDVEEHYKLDTAFRASYTHGKGGRVFGLNSEYDALPGVGESALDRV